MLIPNEDVCILDDGDGLELFVYDQPEEAVITITRYYGSLRNYSEIELCYDDMKALQSWLNERFGDE